MPTATPTLEQADNDSRYEEMQTGRPRRQMKREDDTCGRREECDGPRKRHRETIGVVKIGQRFQEVLQGLTNTAGSLLSSPSFRSLQRQRVYIGGGSKSHVSGHLMGAGGGGDQWLSKCPVQPRRIRRLNAQTNYWGRKNLIPTPALKDAPPGPSLRLRVDSLAHSPTPWSPPPESSRLLSGEKPSHNNNIVAVPAGKVVRFFLLFSLQSRLPVQSSNPFTSTVSGHLSTEPKVE